MGISKSEFLNKLLGDKSFNSQQRVKLFGLVAKNFVNSEEMLIKIAKNVEKLHSHFEKKQIEVNGKR